MLTSDIEVIFGGATSKTPSLELLKNESYTRITTKAELLATHEPKVFGTFASGNFNFVADMNLTSEVRLTDMVPIALDILNQNTNGFFVMIEGGMIDYAGHYQNVVQAALEVINFDEAVKQVYNWVQDNPDTLVIVTADHETGWLRMNSTHPRLDNQLPDPDGTEEEKRTRRKERALQMDAVMLSASHGGDDVPFVAFGKGASTLISESCEYRNAHIYKIMKNAFDGIAPSSCPAPILAWPDYVTINPWVPSTTSTSSKNEESIILFMPIPIALILTISLISRRRKRF
jgi:alkaline phosphatase